MTTVRHVLQAKGNQVYSVTPDTTVYDVLKVLAEKNIGAVLVMEGEKLVGVFSERDYARKIVLKGESSQNVKVKDVMTSVVACVNPDQPIEECMMLMTEKHVRHLPVMENDKLVGIISIGDVVKAVISDKEFTISQLHNYITGRR